MKALKLAVLGTALAAMTVPVTPAFADPPAWAKAHGRRAQEGRVYDSQGRYYEPRKVKRSDRIWRGRDGRYHCRRDNGTTGLLIGAGVGALAGNQLASGREKTIATILGAAGGAVIGRAIDRGELKCR